MSLGLALWKRGANEGGQDTETTRPIRCDSSDVHRELATRDRHEMIQRECI